MPEIPDSIWVAAWILVAVVVLSGGPILRHVRWVWRQRRRRRVGIVVVGPDPRRVRVIWGEPTMGANLRNRYGAQAVPAGSDHIADVLVRPGQERGVQWRTGEIETPLGKERL